MADLSRYRDAVHAYLMDHREEMIVLLQQLIQIPSLSVSPQQEECQDLLDSKMRQMGLEIDRWIPDWQEVQQTINPRTHCTVYQPIELTNSAYLDTRDQVSTLVGIYDTGKAGKTMLFNGHIDVVSPEPLSDWTVDPWSGVVRDGRIYGRGSSDQKGGVVAMLYALKAVMAAGADLRGRVLLSVTQDEENGGNGAAAMVARGYRADGGVITDLSENNIYISCIGMQRFKIDITGKAGFMGAADEAVNAVDLMCEMVRSLRNFERARNEYARKTFSFSAQTTAATVNTGRVEAGEWHASIPAKASISGLMGVLADDDLETFRRSFEQQLIPGPYEAWYAEHPPEVTYFGAKEGCMTPPDAPIVRAVEQAASLVRGRPVRGKHGSVATDMNYFVSTGTPCVHFGPGKVGHCADESLALEELWEATEIMALSIIAFLSE